MCVCAFMQYILIAEEQSVSLLEGGLTQQPDFTGWLLIWWMATSVAQPEAKSHSTANTHREEPSAALSQLRNTHTHTQDCQKFPKWRNTAWHVCVHRHVHTHTHRDPPVGSHFPHLEQIMFYSHSLSQSVITGNLTDNCHLFSPLNTQIIPVNSNRKSLHWLINKRSYFLRIRGVRELLSICRRGGIFVNVCKSRIFCSDCPFSDLQKSLAFSLFIVHFLLS